jgi:hypothetical protein
MRPEIKEYNFDWMLWSGFQTASKVLNCSDKEMKEMLPYIPYYRETLEAFLKEGKPGASLVRLFAKYFDNIMTAHEKGKKIAITTFCFSPAIFYAMDVVPITLEVLTALPGTLWKRGTSDYMDYCVEIGFTETSCSSQRGSLGAYLSGLGEEIDFVVCDTPGICDTNANAFAFSAEYLDKPFFQLNYPPTLVDERAGTYHREDYKALIAFIEEQAGKKLDEDRLREILQEICKQDELIAELEEMQRLVPSPIPVLYNLYIYAGRFLFAGTSIYTELLKDMVEQARINTDAGIPGLYSGVEKVRAFFCYIDHYNINLKLWDWLDRNGVTHLGSILSRFYPDNAPYAKGRDREGYHMDLSTFDTMIDAIAQMNSRMPMVRTIRGPYDSPHMWLEDALTLSKIYKADCLVYNGTPGCRNTWGMVKPFARDIEKAGYPIHIMYGDAFDDRIESWEATAARLDEFFKVRGLL